MRVDVCRIWIISKTDEMFYNLASFFKGLDIGTLIQTKL